MALKVGDKYVCSYCGKSYHQYQEADACLVEHDLTYVPFTKTDLNRLINFIYLKDESLLTDSLLKTLNKYLKGK